MSHLYVVRIGTTIKVGESGVPAARFDAYVRDARRYGLPFSVLWVSPAHVEVFANKEAILARFRPKGQRDEYLRGVDPAEIVAFARALPMTPTGDRGTSDRVVAAAHGRTVPS